MSLLLITLLAACASTGPSLTNSAPSVVVQVPVPVACVGVVPPLPRHTEVDASSLKRFVATILADLEMFENYAALADTLLRQCAKEPQ